MVRILGWEISRGDVDGCEVCERHDVEFARAPMREVRGVNLCSRCEALTELRNLLDLQYWRSHPDNAPVCLNCGKSVPPEQIRFTVCFDWYFCMECASSPEVLQRFEKLREAASK